MAQIRIRAMLALGVLLLTGPILAADLRVPADFPTIAAAFAAASPGDRVVVSPGSYGEFALDLPAGVTLIGDPAAPSSVVVDAGGRGRVLRAESLDLPSSVIGLTLTGGRAGGENAYDCSGGGLLVSRADVRLERVRLIGNTAEHSGGGLRVADGRVAMVLCTLRDNVAGRGGGGMDLSYGAEASALETRFAGNAAAWGGAASIRSGSTTSLRRCRLESNQALPEPGLGGALACDLASTAFLTQVMILDNEARHGGALYAATEAVPHLAFTTLDRNVATADGGGVYCKDASIGLDHSIVSFHPQSAFAFTDEARVTLTDCDVYGNEGGDWTGRLADQLGRDGNFCADPLYCAPDRRSLHEDSPCAPENSGRGLVGGQGVRCRTATGAPASAGVLTAGAHPNPFNPRTEIVFMLPVAGRARVSVFDVRGRRLAVLLDEPRPAGEHRVRWEARDATGRALASGTYLLVVEAGGQRATTKLTLLR